MNVFNFVILIYESRSTSFSMKRKNQLNGFELMARRGNGMCVCVFNFHPNTKLSQEKEKKEIKTNLFTLSRAPKHREKKTTTVFVLFKL